MEVIKSDSNNTNQVLHNISILQNIFSNLDLSNLKNVRHVCRLWSNEAVRGFTNKILVHHNPSLLRKINEINLTSFLQNHKIQYALILSFLNNPWYHCKLEDQLRWETLLYKKYLKQRNNRKYLQVLSTFFLQSCSDVYLTELRIELNIFHEKDSDLLVSTLSKTVNLEKLAIDFVLVKKEIVNSLPDELLVPLNKLKLLAFRCGKFGINYEVFDLECWIKILGLFPGIKYLDLISWKQMYVIEQDPHVGSLELCCQALQLLNKEKQYFQSLEGWRYRYSGDNGTRSLPFLQKLKFLVIRDIEREKVILSYHLPSLRRCELLLSTFDTPSLSNMILPSFPVLEYLGLCIDSRHYDDFERADILKIREIILGGAESFKRIFPSLHTLNITVSREIEKNYFNYMFPKEVNIKIPGITSISISLNADCESEEITRLLSMFPDLEILKHVVEHAKYSHCFMICTHTQDKNTKKFIPVRNNLVQIHKNPDWDSEDVIYFQLRGTFCKEPFYWGYKVIQWFAPDEESDTTAYGHHLERISSSYRTPTQVTTGTNIIKHIICY